MAEKKPNPKPKSFLLSSKGLANFVTANVKQNFAFLVGKNPPFAEYKINPLVATFISPKVAELYVADPTISSFRVPIEDESKNFQLVIDLVYNKRIDPTDIQRIFLREVSKILGNDELYGKFAGMTQLKTTNVIPQMEEKYKNSMDICTEIDLIAENISQFQAKDFVNTPISIIERIFASEKLLIDDEDTLCKLLIDFVEARGEESRTLFSFIIFENLSKESLEKLIEVIKIDDIKTLLWSSIKRRLTSDVKRVVEAGNRYCKSITDCEYTNDIFKGIFFALKQKYLGNPVDKDVVALKVVGQHGSTQPRNLFDMSKQNNWGLESKAGNYLLMDFKKLTVSITGYSIKSGSSSHWDYEQSWVLEGSNDGINWTTIDDKPPNREMGGNDRSHYWKCAKSDDFRMIRWRIQKDGGATPIVTSQFELFGEYITHFAENDKDGNEEEDVFDDDSSTFPFMGTD